MLQPSPLQAEAGFEVKDYMQQRAENPSLVMVEIGHANLPVAYQQPFSFTEQRAYIGIEAWLRGGKTGLAKMKRDNPAGQNIFYISQDTGGKATVNPYVPAEYEGPFDTQTRLPDKAADEVFASNVFTDPLVGEDEERSSKLLAEVSRIIDDDGVIVLKETATPEHSTYIRNEEFLALFGLQVAAVAKRDRWWRNSLWRKLEYAYKHPRDLGENDYTKSFYLFLTKNS